MSFLSQGATRGAARASWFTSCTAFSKDVYDGSIVSEDVLGSREETVMSRWNFGELTKRPAFEWLAARQVLPGTLIQ
jgi:hypothetical protein